MTMGQKMVSKIQQQQVRQLITQTLNVLCQNSLPYNAVVNIEGLLGITIDHDDVFLVNIQQSIQRPLPPHSLTPVQMPVQFVRQTHSAGNHISTPLTQHSPHDLLHSPHGRLSTSHGSLASPRGSLPSPQGVPQGIPQGVPQGISHGIPPAMMTSPKRHATPSPCQGFDLHVRKRPSAMNSRTPEPGIMGLNEPADLSMRSMRHRSRNRSMSPLAKVPRVSPHGVQSDVEKRVSMILQTAQAEMKDMEINKRRHVQHYSRHKTEAPSDGFKKQHNHLANNDGLTMEQAQQLIIKVEPRESDQRIADRNIHGKVLNEKENYPEAWNILPELTAKWYRHNGRSPNNNEIITRQDNDSDDITCHTNDVTTGNNDITTDSETMRNSNVTNEDSKAKDNGVTNDNSNSGRDTINGNHGDEHSTTQATDSESEIGNCSTVGTILIVKQEIEEQSSPIVPEDKQSVAPSDGGGGSDS